MAQAKGSKGRLGYQEETAFGIMPASFALKNLYFVSESLSEKINAITSDVIRDSRNPVMPVRGNRDVSGTIKTQLAPSLGTLLRAALGANTTTGASSPYTHTMKVGDLPSLFFEKGFTDLGAYLLFAGCKVNRLSISAKPEGYQDISFDVFGAYEAQALKYKTQTGNFAVGNTLAGGTSTHTALIKGDNDGGETGLLCLLNATGVFQDGEALSDSGTGAAVADGTLGSASVDSSLTDPGHAPFNGFSIATVQEGGSDIACLSAVDIVVENNLDGNSYVLGGGGVRRAIPEGTVKVSGTLTALFESMALYQKALSFTESSLKLIWKHGTGAGTAGNESLEILIPELKFSKETPAIEGPKGILYKGPFEAYYHDAVQASAIQIILKNAEATI
ncbi:MAG: hypothetical protein HPY65_13835 [Syntrophaceae bacterium]|nr:hypothetical protein [Syntrophaceae bacterium]